jgi:hypothetical protein
VLTAPRADDRTSAVVAVLAGALMAAPLWVGRFLPLLDLPQHLAIATVLLHHGDPAWRLAEYFQPQRTELTPYWTHYLALESLGRLMPVGAAARVVLTAYVFALPWAVMALARALGRTAAAGLLAAPLALNANLYYGFIAYCSGVVLLLFGLALLVRQLDAPRPGRAAGLVVLAAAIFFTHVQAFAFLALAAPVLAFAGEGPAWRRALRALPLAPTALGLFVPWLYLGTTPRPGAERYFPPLGEPGARYEGLGDRVAGLPAAIAGSYQDHSDDWLLGAWAVTVTLAAWSSRRSAAAGETVGGGRKALALVATALVCSLALPFSIQGQWNIGPRFAWVMALLLPTLIRRPPVWVPAATLVLAGAVAAHAAWHHARFDREAGPFDRALGALPPGAHVLGLIHDPRGQVLERWPYLHFEQYAVVRGGGLAAHSFATHAPMPVRVRPEARAPVPSVWRPQDFRYHLHGKSFDHFLVRDPTGHADTLAALGAEVTEVFREQAWTVYRRNIAAKTAR